ncbi:transcriptional regulator [Bizionia saleffrena]|uniref:Transcriptional regulator n=1 Tax=Bizionia saleffrena TaxID=291189 RepID=A0A8H2LMN6_9FLAO|nr:transcriptional regulator [Bizionia saleffrena]TYB75951.1 transcriptional regulator [Bizionia saleffrena]
MTNPICDKKSELVEKLGVHMENTEHLAPVAARILAYIILTGKVGTTFEDLVLRLCASKSTISTHLHHLQDLSKIQYFTKVGDRKKYFVINPDKILQKIDDMLSTWCEEKQLHVEVKSYKESINALEQITPAETFDLSFHNDYIQFIDEASASMRQLKIKIDNNKSEI